MLLNIGLNHLGLQIEIMYLRRKRVEFTREHLLNFLEQKCISTETHFSPNSLKKDIGVLVNNYTRPDKIKNLIQKLEKYSKSQWYSIQNTQRPELPHEIILFCILDRFEGQTISFNDLLNGKDSNMIDKWDVLKNYYE